MISHFMPLISFYNPWKHHKTRGFLKFSGGIEIDQHCEIGQGLPICKFLEPGPYDED